MAPFSTYICIKEAQSPSGKKNAWHPGLLELYLPLHLVVGLCCPVWYPFTLGGKRFCLFLQS